MNDNLAKEISKATDAAFIDRTIEHSHFLRPTLIDNSIERQNDVLSYIKKGLSVAKEFMISVSFIRMSGVSMLLQTLKDLEGTDTKGRIITTDYLRYTEPKALKKLLSCNFIDIRVITEEAFHTKGYLFDDGKKNTIIIGSSNLTGGALKENKEWNIKSTSLENGYLAEEFRNAFEELWDKAVPLSEGWLNDYEKEYQREQKIRETVQEETRLITYTIEPNYMQKKAAESLHRLREEGKKKALLIAATGTGKTYLSAFDVRSFNPRHMLFIVHREQILRDAAESFVDVLGTGIKGDIGFLTGNHKDLDKKFIFSTIQTISNETYHKFDPEYFDYIIIDEVHKAAAPSYRKIMDYFNPEFILGMSATPDRPDKENIYELFDYNIALDLRLKEAMENKLLCPFHYFGVSDIKVNGEPLPEEADFNDLTSNERIRNILEKSEYYGYSGDRVKGLIFCSRVEEAVRLSEILNMIRKNDRRNWQTRAVSGSTAIEKREEYVARLQSDEDDESVLDFILTVDVFNEGVDIPRINQVIMLRPTESSIIFIQQLGRGLRKNAIGKEYLVAIDFIGNYKKSFLIPIALSGDYSYDKDNLRKYITEGSSVIPGPSTIDFDKIAKELIYKNIDTSDLKEMAILRKEYFSLKNRLGRIPSINDFYKEKAIDVQNFVEKSGSYYSFLRKVDKDFRITISSDEETVLNYISEKFSDGKRNAELLFFKTALECYSGSEEITASSCISDFRFIEGSFKGVFQSMIRNLDMSFLKLQETKKFGKEPLIELKDGVAVPSQKLARMLKDPDFRWLLKDVIEDGLRRFRETYRNTYLDTPFVLYEKYTYEDVCRLLCWDTNMNPLNIGGYFFDSKTRTLPVFINYSKGSEDINYADRFFDESNLIAASKKKRKPGCPDYQHIYKTTEKDKENKIYLFVRKNNEDTRKEFYFLGKIEATGEPEPIQIDGCDVFEIHYVLSTPVRRDIYDYLTFSNQ